MNTASITATTDSKPRLRGYALISVIAALMLTLFLEALDQTIVGTALPRIIEELHGLDRYSWVVTAYNLATMTMIPIVGKLSDQFGRKWFLLSGATLFLLGSILAGASQSMDQLIIFRAVHRHRHSFDCYRHGRSLPARSAGEMERPLWPCLWRLKPARPNHRRVAR